MLNQFSRTELLLGKEKMEYLKNARVAVFGIGGVGGYTVEALALSLIHISMIFAMKEAGVKPEEIDYINAHGTSTHHNDLFETRAIKLALKDAAYNVKINSTKSMIGHLLGAAGGVEFITCVKSIEDNYIHQTVGLKNPDEECDLNYMAGKGEYTEVNVAMTNSLGSVSYTHLCRR